MTFKEFVSWADKINLFGFTPEDDFCSDAAADKTLPEVRSWKKLKEYLDSLSGVDDKAYPAAKSVFRFWARSHRRQPGVWYGGRDFLRG